jgi:hypothetical protein
MAEEERTVGADEVESLAGWYFDGYEPHQPPPRPAPVRTGGLRRRLAPAVIR